VLRAFATTLIICSDQERRNVNGNSFPQSSEDKPAKDA